jgi:hypothetical protein
MCFYWVNENNIAVAIQDLTQFTSCLNVLAPVRQSFSRMSVSFSQVQRVFAVEHCLAPRSCLTCQNEFSVAFPDIPVPNRSTVSRLVKSYRDTGSVRCSKCSGRPSLLSDDTLDDCTHHWKLWTFPTLNVTLSFVFWFQGISFFNKKNVWEECVAWLVCHSVLLCLSAILIIFKPNFYFITYTEEFAHKVYLRHTRNCKSLFSNLRSLAIGPVGV